MMTLGLTSAERRAYEAALRSSHTRQIDVDILTLDGTVMSNVTAVLVDGQVNVDLDAEVTRNASVTFLDPNHAINFDTDSPDDGAVYADRMIRIRYGVRVEELGRYVYATVFTGPVTGLTRDDAVVQIEAQGKESLTRGALWRPLTLKKGLPVVSAIRVLMGQRGGETRFSIPDVRNTHGKRPTLPKARSLDRMSEIWATAAGMARGINRQLFYPGSGILTLRNWPSAVSYTFRTGDGGDVLTSPSIKYQLDGIKNVVVVKGQPPSGKKGVIWGVATAPKNHPMSPFRLGRNGAPRYLVEVIEDQSIRSDASAKALAKRILDDRLREAVEITFDAMPIPHLDPGDMVRIQTPEFTSKFRLRQFAIPLAPNGAPAMPVGYLRNLTASKRLIKRRGSKR